MFIHSLLSLFLGTAMAATGTPTPKTLIMGVPYKFNRIQALVEYHDLLAKAFDDIGYKIEFKPIAIQSAHEMIISGAVDTVSYDDMVEATGREKIVTTSFPIAITRATIFYAKTRPVKQNALEKYRGAISKNNAILIQHAKKRKLKFVQTTSPFHCIQTVIEKKTDFCITFREIGITTINAIPNSKGTIVFFEEPFVRTPVHLSLNKKYGEDLPRLENALRKRLKGDLTNYPAISQALNTSP